MRAIIIGIGTDIIEIDRIKHACEKGTFLNKYFTDKEIELLKNNSSLAGNFAAKEAFVKSVGTGFGKINASEIEVLRDSSGAPFVNLYGNAKAIAENKGIKNVHVSISHCKDYAVAFVISDGAINNS